MGEIPLVTQEIKVKITHFKVIGFLTLLSFLEPTFVKIRQAKKNASPNQKNKVGCSFKKIIPYSVGKMSEKERNSPVKDKSPSLMAKKLKSADRQKQVAKGKEYFSSPCIMFILKPF
jgi:hypothetical protein